MLTILTLDTLACSFFWLDFTLTCLTALLSVLTFTTFFSEVVEAVFGLGALLAGTLTIFLTILVGVFSETGACDFETRNRKCRNIALFIDRK